jgi:hypothetical protein
MHELHPHAPAPQACTSTKLAAAAPVGGGVRNCSATNMKHHHTLSIKMRVATPSATCATPGVTHGGVLQPTSTASL